MYGKMGYTKDFNAYMISIICLPGQRMAVKLLIYSVPGSTIIESLFCGCQEHWKLKVELMRMTL